MTLVSYQPWTRSFNRLHRQIDQLFGDVVANPAAEDTINTVRWSPAVDVHEEATQFTVRADLPGVEAKDIQVTADNGVLTIRGERHLEKRETQQGGYERYERVAGTFQRRFTLPDTVRADEIRARHSNGVLEVVIPKQPVAEPRRVNIEVN
jgi:HSP20 family protein